MKIQIKKTTFPGKSLLFENLHFLSESDLKETTCTKMLTLHKTLSYASEYFVLPIAFCLKVHCHCMDLFVHVL